MTRIDEHAQLRLLAEDDAGALAAVTNLVSPEMARSWIRAILHFHESGRGRPYAIVVDGQTAGYALLEIHDNHEGLLHYGLVSEYRGRGLATRACLALVDEAFRNLGLHLLKIDPQTRNPSACRVAERAGFRRSSTYTVEESNGRVLEIARYRLDLASWIQNQQNSTE